MISVTEFKALISKHGGDDKLLALLFDGNFRVMFTKDNPFKMSEMLDEANQVIVLKEKVDDKYEYTIIKPVETMFGMVFIPDRENDTVYQYREIFH